MQLVGQTLDRYQVKKQVGQGELGAVYRAHDPALLRDVAIKVIDLQQLAVPDAAERVLERARLAARLDHPGLIKVHDFGRTDSLLYIVMEYLPGGNLRQLLQDLRAANQWVLLSEAVQVVRQVSLVLDYANRQGARLLRVRPSDIMLKPEQANGLPYRPVLTDLGLGDLRPAGDWRPAAAEAPASADTQARPPYAYWSPEQALGEPMDARSQVYSLGVLLYELAVGWQPFAINSVAEAVRAHTRAEPPRPRARRADLPAPLEGVILKALEKDPARRYPDPGVLADALREMQPLAEQAEAGGPAEVPGAGWAVSLLVPYQRSLQAQTRSDPEGRYPGPTIAVSRGRLRVDPAEGTPFWIAIPTGGLTLGRDIDNDVVLNDPSASPRHARLEFDGRDYTVTDLNSQSGTFLGGSLLPPGVPQVWPADVPLRLGSTQLHLEPSPRAAAAAAAAERRAFFRFDGTVIDASLIQTSAGGRVGVYIEVPQLTVTPGNKTSAGVVVINQGPDVDRFILSVDGVPANWITPPALPPSVQLTPGGYQRLRLTLAPPRTPTSRAGRYTVRIRVASQNFPDEAVEARVALSVTAFSQFHPELSVVALAVNEVARLVVHNQGNIPETYAVAFEDPGNELVFDPPGANLSVPAGQAAALDFSPALQRPRLIGGRRSHPFSVRVMAPAGQAERLAAEVLSRAFVPPWVPLLLLMMGCLLASTLVFAWSSSQQRARATQTAMARQTTDAIAAADSDGDGLSNSEEVRLRTDPLNPDTDGDSLSDGLEVTLGTSPLVADSDGDTLPDGREVNELHTNPLKADTDGDGLPDNVDPDPGNLPTPTASPTFTPLPPTATDTPLPATATLTPEPPTATFTPLPATATLTPEPPTATFTPVPPTAVPPTSTSVVASPTVAPTAPGSLLFETDRDGNREIYVMKADGSGQARLTTFTPASNSSNPAWSAATQKIAFQSDAGGNTDIYVINADGSGTTRLTDAAGADTSPAWSPDGTHIAFVSERDGNREIYVMGADGSGETRLTNSPGVDERPLWSPDGTRLLFETDRDGNRELYVMSADGSNPTRLTNNGAGDSAAAWAPNGNWIAFVSNRDGNNEIYLMAADGSGQIRLTNNPAPDGGPAWAPNSARLAFVSERDGNPEIYVMNADGTSPVRITASPGLDTGPIWSPDGARLAFVSERDGNAEVYIANADGSAPARLTNNSAFDAPIIWRP